MCEEGERDEGPGPAIEQFGRTLVLETSSGLTFAAVGLKVSRPLDCLLLPGEPPGCACGAVNGTHNITNNFTDSSVHF